VSDPGFLAVPYVLLLHQAQLDIGSEHLNVLLNILAHWHAEGRMPYPHSATIAKRMGVTQRTVQRSIVWLCKSGFLAKLPRERRTDRQAYDVTPLLDKLAPLAAERIKYIQAKDFDEVLSDRNWEIAPPRPAAEMFKDVLNSKAQT
jgi:DNA-binding MarR family transcriptional regulator